VILCINKVDTVPEKETLMARILDVSQRYDFTAVVPTSARTGDNFDALREELFALAEPSVHFFPDDTLTDQPERVIVAEILREKMLRLLDKEIPHGTAVSIEKMREREDSDLVDIDAVIYCEKESHKGIIIGKNGAMLKRVSTRAREDMERFLCCRVNLQCWVKVKEDWRNREGLIRNFGLEYKNNS
jgi:GTP-binding protein Era